MALLSEILAASTVSGQRGPGGTATVGTTTTVVPSASPSVNNSGTTTQAVFNFSLPRAVTLTLGTTSVINPNVNPSISSSTDGNGDRTFTFSLPRAPAVSLNATPVLVVNPNVNPSLANTGTNGDSVYQFSLPRASAVSIGTVTTGAAGSSAIVTNSGTNGDVVLNFTIPQGASGAGAQVYPGAGVAVSTGTVWGTSLTATNANTASALVQRDASGNFSAGTITATLSGNATSATSATIQPNIPVSTNTTIVSGDKGKFLDVAAGVTINTSTAFSAGDVVSIYNDSAASITITATGVTLRLAGTATSGNRTLAQRGLVTILCVASNEYVASGAGLT